MKVVLTLLRQDSKIEEIVEIPGLDIEDRPAKLLEAARQFVAPRNAGRPSWDPIDKLLSATFLTPERAKALAKAMYSKTQVSQLRAVR